jgi:hypothetical protein
LLASSGRMHHSVRHGVEPRSHVVVGLGRGVLTWGAWEGCLWGINLQMVQHGDVPHVLLQWQVQCAVRPATSAKDMSPVQES